MHFQEQVLRWISLVHRRQQRALFKFGRIIRAAFSPAESHIFCISDTLVPTTYFVDTTLSNCQILTRRFRLYAYSFTVCLSSIQSAASEINSGPLSMRSMTDSATVCRDPVENTNRSLSWRFRSISIDNASRLKSSTILNYENDDHRPEHHA